MATRTRLIERQRVREWTWRFVAIRDARPYARPEIFVLVFGLALFCLLTPGCKPKEMQAVLGPSEALVSVVAEEAAALAGSKKQVALITHDASWGAPSSAEEALKHALKKKGLTLAAVKSVNLGNPMLSGAIGLKGQDFLDALQQSATSGVVISLIGAPRLTADDAKHLAPDHPPVIVVATAMLGDKMGVRGELPQLAPLLDAHIIQLAVIDGGEPGTNGSGKTDGTQKLFAQNYQILRQPK